MRVSHRVIALILSSAALASSSALTGCAADTTVYDPYWRDYHRWTARTQTYRSGVWERRSHVNCPTARRRSTGL